MDTFTAMTGFTMMFFAYLGERFRTGVYLWLALVFAIIFSLRMAEPMFYMGTAGIIIVLAYRTFFASEDVRNTKQDNE